MKRLSAILVSLLFLIGTMAGCATQSAPSSSAAPESTSSAPEAADSTAAPSKQTVSLEVGTMEVYDFGDIKLHAYETKDPIADENFLLETADELILIELIGFNKNIEELQGYIADLGKPLNSVIVAYHPAGGDAYPGTQMYASEGLGEAGLVAGFVEAFGDVFNGNLPTEYELVAPGTMTIGGVEFNVIQTADAFDLEIPAINVYMTHMLGANTHNILVSVEQIDGMIAQMKEFQAKDYALLLTGHDVPRTIEIAAEKIEYLEKTKELIASSGSAESFTAAMKEAFPGYQGENYLEMSAGALFGAGESATPENVVVKEIGDVKLHSFLSASVSPVIIESDSLTIIDFPGDAEENQPLFKAYVDSLGKPIERYYISHVDAAHWVGIESQFPDTEFYSVDADEIKAAEGGADLNITAIADGSQQTSGGVNLVFEVDREIGAWMIKMPDLKAAYVDHIGYVNLHVLLAPLEPRLAHLKALDSEGYTWYMPGHGVPMEGPAFVTLVETYYGDVLAAVAASSTPEEAKAIIVEKHPDYVTEGMLDGMLPAFFS